MVLSNQILSEYAEIIERKANKTIAVNICEMLLSLPNVSKTDIHYKWGIISSGPDDNKFVDCAVASGADYLVTNDKHFDEVDGHEFPKINVIDEMIF